ncbi:MAG TPA: hypothetical protein VH573_21195 [Mycobacteriales bacterium]
MADVLSSGPEPGGPSHPRRRWTTPLAGALVAAAAVYLAVHAGGGMAEDPRAAGPTPSAPAPTGATPTGPAPTPATYRLHGDPGLGPTGVRILVGGRRPAVLDAGTGRLAPLPIRLGPVDVAELDHAGGTTTVVLHNPYRLRSRAVAVGRSGKAVALGQALDALPLRDGSVLTQDCSDPGGTGPCTLTGYAATGAVLWRRPEPRPLDLVRDTPYGLLVRTYDTPRGGVVQLEDPRSGATYRVIGRAAGILGADDRQVVFAPASCATECDLVLADLDTGSSRFLPENPGSPTVAAFSRDGRRVAIGYAGMLPDDRSADPQRDGHVVVIDQHRSDFWQSVPEVTTGPASTALPVWSPDGRLLLAVPTDGSGSGRVVAWQPGAPRVTVLPVGLTGFYGIPGLAAPLS